MGDVVNVHEAKSSLSRLLERVEKGEHITIARAGRPVADLVPHTRVDVVFGAAAGLLSYDADTFDEPVPELTQLFEQA
jgi:prevent-host-death family protein